FRTIAVEITDTVGRDPEGGSIHFRAWSEFLLEHQQAELRFFYRGINTVAEYHNNGVMSLVDEANLEYERSVDYNPVENRPLQVGDVMEFELSQFLDKEVEDYGGRANYYGTTYLYEVGKGLIPWQTNGPGPADGECAG